MSKAGTSGVDYGVALNPRERAFSDEVREFLHRALTADMRGPAVDAAAKVARARAWQERLHAARLAAISWPEEFGGRSATPVQQLIYNSELAAARAPDPINRNAINQLGPTIVQWGTADQQRRFLPRILSAEDVWCQGFSEPDAGSDLASLRTRAEADGDELVVTGQKIWTSNAQHAEWIYMLVRTDPTAEKHRGISFILAELSSPGVEVRPIRQITGRSEFNEVFFDHVRVPASHVVGPLHQGWAVARSTLSYERVGQSRTHRIERRLRKLIDLALMGDPGQSQLDDDAAVADRVVRLTAQVEALRQIAAEATAAGVRGRSPGPESSIAKLLTSEVDQALSVCALDIAGEAAILERNVVDPGLTRNVALSYLLLRAATIGAGTSEIQRNIVGEKLLGLPRDE